MITGRISSARHNPPSCLTALVSRRPLLETLERQRHKRLLLVHASAGYGKTILMSQWRDHLRDSGAASIWVELEKADASSHRFVASLAAGLVEAGIVPLESRACLGAEEGRSDPMEWLLSLAEQSSRETWIILDDWHQVDASETRELMEALLRKLPANWHVALSGRVRPKLNLMMMRARGQLVELCQDDLRFSPEEARQLMGPRMSAGTAANDLVELTEGWPIALQLAHLWLEGENQVETLRSSFIDTIDGMADFLAAEVFAALPSELRECLLESSICAQFSPSLLDFVRERPDSEALIETLRSPNGLTIAIPGKPGWYRHHRILAEFLERERRHLPRPRLAHLHSRAASWFERNDMLFEAVAQARASGDEERTIQLVEDAGCVDICIRTGASAVRALLDSLPSEVVRQRPRLRAAYTAVNFKMGSIGRAGEFLAELQASANGGEIDAVLRRDLLVVQNLRQCFIDESPTEADLARQRASLEANADAEWWVQGLMHNVQGRLEMRRGRLNDAVGSLTRADEVFQGGGSAQGHFFMLANLAICQLYLGSVGQADNHLAHAHDVLKRQLSDAPAYTGIIHTVEALLLYERNELPSAGHAAQLALAGLELAEGCFEQYFTAIHVAARVALTLSGLEAALRFIDRGRQLARYHELLRMERLLDNLQLRLTVDADEWEAAAQLAGQPDVLPPASPASGWLEHDLAMPSHCLLALHAGRAEEARRLAQAMARGCAEGGRLPGQVRAHVLEALAGAALDDPDGTNDALHAAIELAGAEGLLQPFFEAGPAILPLLRDFQRAAAITLAPAHADFLAGLILRVIAAGKASAYTEQLTARECQILDLLAGGGSNKVIARALDLSENAVKFHLKNVFRKLRVDNRAMAAQVGRRLDLAAAR